MRHVPFTAARPCYLAGAFILQFVVLLLAPPATAQGPGSLDTPFDAAVNGGIVYATAVQPDGKIIIGGSFISVGGAAHSNIARLNADGSVDASFMTDTNAAVTCVAVLPDGKMIIGGGFTSVNGSVVSATNGVNYIARLNADGTLDTAFNASGGTGLGGANNWVYSVAVQADGKLVLGGEFTGMNGSVVSTTTGVNRIARLNADGTLDTAFNASGGTGLGGVNSSVFSVAVQADGKLVLGGGFTSVNGSVVSTTTGVNRIARLNADGTLDTTFNASGGTGLGGVNSSVFSVAVQADGKLVLGGGFTSVNGSVVSTATGVNRMARLNADGTLDTTFNASGGIGLGGANGEIISVTVQADGKLVLGGAFTSVNGSVVSATTGVNRIARLNADGTLDTAFNASGGTGLGGAIGNVYSVALQADGKIILGGAFTTVNGTARSLLARLTNNGATQSLTVPAATQVLWSRGGSGPELSAVIFEQSNNGGTTWTTLGAGSRVGTTANWRITGLALSGTVNIRARGRAAGGYANGSASLVEQTASLTVPPAAPGKVVAWGHNAQGQTKVPGAMVAIAAGYQFTMALNSNGTVSAWGDNFSGQSSVPSGLGEVTAIAAGSHHAVALKSNGTVVAWGNNTSGQINVPSGLGGVTAIAAGWLHTVALKSDGTVVAWGSNGYGQRAVPSGLSGVIAISAGHCHTVALKNDGTVVAWGSNYYGQRVGPSGLSGVIAISAKVYNTVALKSNGTVVAWGANTYGQTTIPPGLSGVTAISSGGSHTVALKSDGTVVAWGDNYYGQRTIPGGLSNVIAIAAGQNRHTVALKSDGTVVAWGSNALGQTSVPPFLKDATAIAAGAHHSLALNSTGTVVAWGDNWTGQTSVPAGLSGVTAISAGAHHTVALKSSGTLAAWGMNSYGQTTIPPGLSGVAAISAGFHHTVALKTDGTVVAWGWNGNGQTTIPVGLSGVTAIAAGSHHTVALKSDGTVVAWGLNGNGQTTIPVGLSGVTAIAAGSHHTVALKSDGTVVAWGLNGNGQTTVPVGLSGVTAISAGFYHTVALKNNGTVVAWGRSTEGQTTVPALLSDVTAIAAGGYHTLAIGNLGQFSDIYLNHSTRNLLTTSTTLTLTGSGFDAGTPRNNSIAFTPDSVSGIVTSATATSLTVSVSGLTPGPLGAVVTSNGQSSGEPVQVATVMAVLLASEFTVTGNSMNIPDGDTTPATADFTDFGNVALLNARVPHDFTLSHSGGAPGLSGMQRITLSGPDAEDFEVTAQPQASMAAGVGTKFTITFDPALPGVRTATVSITDDDLISTPFTFAIRGHGVQGTMLKQAITFTPPTAVHLGQGPLSLSAFASSRLPVTLSVVSNGTTAPGAGIVGNTLSFTGTGTVKVLATQAGDLLYAAAPALLKTITVKADPAGLTLLDLVQTYTGTPRPVTILNGPADVVYYTVNKVKGITPPTSAGSYPVEAVAGGVKKLGTLIITKAPLYVTPDDQVRFIGQENPALTLSYSGFVNDETDSVVTTAPALKTTATSKSVGGVYPITASGGVVAANYAFVYQQGSLVVESFAGNYEALLMDDSRLVGKLTVTVANTGFTGRLSCIDEKSVLALKGGLIMDADSKSATGVATATSRGVTYVVSITTQADGSLDASINLDGDTLVGDNYANSSAGRRLLTLAAGKTVAFAGAHTAVLEPAIVAAAVVPAGAGWATAAISTKGVMTLAGRLGDGTAFTSALSADDASDPGYRLFLQPYRTGAAPRLQSHFGGAFKLVPHPSLAGRRHVEAAVMTWVKPGLPTDESYRTGFGVMNPVSSVLMLDPWLPPAAAKRGTPAIPLATRLGLTSSSFEVLHANTGSTLNDNLPTRAGLGSTNSVTVTAPAANKTKWKATLVPATGLFSGSFELADTIPKPRAVNFSGVLRQPVEAPDALIGDGHYLLPPLAGTEKTTGEIMFLRP